MEPLYDSNQRGYPWVPGSKPIVIDLELDLVLVFFSYRQGRK
jgi:hypothetical protein